MTNGITAGHTPIELWRHPDPRNTRMWAFKDTVNSQYRINLQTYDDLYQWSIENIAQFWAATWSFIGVEASQPFEDVGLSSYSRDHPYLISSAIRNGHAAGLGTSR